MEIDFSLALDVIAAAFTLLYIVQLVFLSLTGSNIAGGMAEIEGDRETSFTHQWCTFFEKRSLLNQTVARRA